MPSPPTGKHCNSQTDCVFCFVFSAGFHLRYASLTGRIPQTQWNSTQTRRTSLTCGRRKCFRIRRTRGERGAGSGWACTLPSLLSIYVFCRACYFFQGYFFFSLHPRPIIRLFQEQKRCMESSTLQREVKKVRKARNRRQEWNMMAFDKELRPDHRHPQTLRRGASSEGSLSPDGRSGLIF